MAIEDKISSLIFFFFFFCICFWINWPNLKRKALRIYSKLQAPSLRDYYEKVYEQDPRNQGLELLKALDEADARNEIVQDLFKRAGTNRKHAMSLSNHSTNYAIAEMEGLRLEVADIKRREIGNERYVSGVFAAVSIAFFESFFLELTTFILTIFSFGFAFFGFWRFREYQRNNFEVDCYLRELEFSLRNEGGWATFFFKIRSPISHFHSRPAFWKILLILSGTLCFLALLDLLGKDLSWIVKKEPLIQRLLGY